MSRPTAIFSAIRGFALANSRTLLIEHLLQTGWRVVIASQPDKYTGRLESLGAEVVAIPYARGGLSPFRDVRSFVALKRLYRKLQPQLVHHFNVKPVLLGSLAARSAPSARVFNSITGLGYSFSRPGVTRTMANWGYRLLIGRSSAVVFQNSDDLAYFRQQGWVNSDNARLIVSSGVDTERFSPRADSWESVELRVLMACRLIWQKGVREYVEAAASLRRRFPHVRFQLAGEWEPAHPDAVPQEWVERMASQGNIEFLGYLNNMEEVLPRVDLFVLPSAYREGVPRVLLEAGACGVPVVTTDSPGCREVVRDGQTGRLVKKCHVQSLADAMEELLIDGRQRVQWGRAARAMMQQQYDLRAITERYLDLYRAEGLIVDPKQPRQSELTHVPCPAA